MKKIIGRPYIALTISIFLHLAFLWNIALDNQSKPIPKTLEITILTTPPEKKPRIKQMVEQDKQINQAADKVAKYLSEYDRMVEKETKAKDIGKFDNSSETAKANHDILAANPASATTETVTVDKTNSNSDIQSAKTDDYLKDIEEGRKTILATREFTYYAYFKKIKAQIQAHWESGIKAKIEEILKSGRHSASVSGVTKLLIILDSDGTLQKVQRISSSGIEDLDDSAILAFQAASPFPNPPPNLIERDGTIKIRWDFIVE